MDSGLIFPFYNAMLPAITWTSPSISSEIIPVSRNDVDDDDLLSENQKGIIGRIQKKLRSLRRKGPSKPQSSHIQHDGIQVSEGKLVKDELWSNLIDTVIRLRKVPEKETTHYPLSNCGDIKRRALIAYNTKHRYGAEPEADYLQEQLETLDFEIENCIDFGAEEFLEKLEKFCKKSAKKTSILVVVIMSHGSWGRVHDKDDRWININEVQKPMTIIPHNIPKVLIIQACQGGLHKNSRDYDGQPPVAPVTARSTDAHMLDVDMVVIMSTLWGQISARQFFIPILSDVLKEAVTEPMEISDIYRKVCSIMTGPERMDYVNRPLKDESVNHSKPVRYAVGEPSRQKIMQIPCMLSTLRKPLIIGRYSSDSPI